MSFGNKENTKRDWLDRLAAVLPEYPSIETAQSYAQLTACADDDESKINCIMQAEAQKLFKTINEKGIVFLVQSPALVTWQVMNRTKAVRMIYPKRLGDIKEFESKKDLPVTATKDAIWNSI